MLKFVPANNSSLGKSYQIVLLTTSLNAESEFTVCQLFETCQLTFGDL